MLSKRILGISLILFFSAFVIVEAQSDGGDQDIPGDTGGSGDAGGGDTGGGGDFDDSDGGGSSPGGDTSGGGSTEGGSDQDDGSDPEKLKNPFGLSTHLTRRLDGNLIFSIDTGTLPAGSYDVFSDGTFVFSFTLSDPVDASKRELFYASYPKASYEQVLDFEVLGKNLQFMAGEEVFFSDYVSSIPDSIDSISVYYDHTNGSSVLTRNLIPDKRGQNASHAQLKLEQLIDGAFELTFKFFPSHMGTYTLWIGDSVRTLIEVDESNVDTTIQLIFASHVSEEITLPLDFDFMGEQVLLKEGENTLFFGVVNYPVEIPGLLSHRDKSPSVFSEALEFEVINSAEDPDLRFVDGLGYFRVSGHPFMNHCLLGSLEYRYLEQRHFFVSNSLGPLELMVHEDEKVLYSYNTGQYFRLADTLEDCTPLEPGEFFNLETQAYQSSLFPEQDDVQGFYDLAFTATQMTQIRSSETISLVQSNYWGEAYIRLTDAVTYRNQTVSLALHVIRASMRNNEAVEFWNDAAMHLINTADAALVSAQSAYASTVD